MTCLYSRISSIIGDSERSCSTDSLILADTDRRLRNHSLDRQILLLELGKLLARFVDNSYAAFVFDVLFDFSSIVYDSSPSVASSMRR